jgi:hypothetical protein
MKDLQLSLGNTYVIMDTLNHFSSKNCIDCTSYSVEEVRSGSGKIIADQFPDSTGSNAVYSHFFLERVFFKEKF